MSDKIEMRIYIAVIFALLSISSESYAADNIAISFTGEIKAGSCNIISGGGQTISLGDYSIVDFSSTGDVSPAKPFEITVDCPVGGPGQATVTFSGAAASNPDLLALDAGGASGIAIRINESNGTLIRLGSPSAVTSLTSGENTLTYQAQYESLVERSAINPGVANATAQFTINYP
ncbi:fimbrial protein [Lelliottia sp. V106_10]|uniref:fimbrial protein n=1 Tax=Lelliottia wanjuensis TaxID=3050585 RepID=UPI00254C9262|nr:MULTISPECIES: fimbrial protein [unclassified Lelliottia]MDK9358862.1 fimbrial protein [Lelliottia sp. V106_16]MDK9373549.1 fimbrial protein [Lelliottia sp. V106_10]MDK9600410.1 fimbrial protein [Lelliottia sp. V106_5]